MPIAIWLLIRVGRAFAATARLLTDRRVLRALPWSYIRTLPRRDRWTGLLTATLLVTLLGTIVMAAAPVASIRFVGWTAALVAGLVGILSSWGRALSRR